MRVGLVIYGDLHTVSGGYLYDRKLVEHLVRAGDEVEVISLPWRSYARRLGDNCSAALFRRLADGRYDCLLQDELNHASLFRLNAQLRRRVRYPIFTIVHHLRSSEAHPAWQIPLYRWIERRYLQSVDGYIFNSRTTQGAVYALEHRLAERPSVVAFPAGDQFSAAIQAEEIHARAQAPGPLRVLFVGNLIPRKNLHMLIDALQRLPDGACELQIVGNPHADPHYTRCIQRQIDRLGLDRRVRLCGQLSDAALAAVLRSNQVLAVPSTYEGFGIVYLEGMAFGLPAIAATSGAAAEIITAGETGYLVPPDQPVVLAQHLGRLSNDRRLLSAMGQAARRRFLAHPTWEDTAARIRKFLLE